MVSLLIRWLLNTLSLFIVVQLMPHHVHAATLTTLAIAAIVLGLLNAVVRPILVFLTFPITLITLGLFIIVLNAAMLELTSALVSGFRIDSFGWAMIAAIVLSIISMITNQFGKSKKERD